MPDDDVTAVTPEDLDGFVEKLNEWGESLPVADQALLQVIIQRASDEVADVEGFGVSGGSFGMSARSILGPIVSAPGLGFKSPGGDHGYLSWVQSGHGIYDPSAKPSEDGGSAVRF